MPFDAQTPDLGAETDAVIRSFGMPPTRTNLFSIAEEMERHLRIYPGGRVRAWQIVQELNRRALTA